MKILSGITRDITCKSGMVGMILHYVESTYSENGKDKGFLTGTQFLDQKEFDSGSIDVSGVDLEIGCGLRIFKETKGGMDVVTTIICSEPDIDIFGYRDIKPQPPEDKK